MVPFNLRYQSDDLLPLMPMIKTTDTGEVSFNVGDEKITCPAKRSLDLRSSEESQWSQLDNKAITLDDGESSATISLVAKELLLAAAKSNHPEEAFAVLNQILKNPHQFIDHESRKYLDNFFERFQSLENIEDLAAEINILKNIGRQCQLIEDDPELFSKFAKVCDRLSNSLLTEGLDYGPLQGKESWELRMKLAAELRTVSAQTFVGQEALGIADFSQPQVPELNMAGNRLDAGVHYQNVGGSQVESNEIVLSQRKLRLSDDSKSPEYDQFDQFSQLDFKLTIQGRRELTPALSSLSDPIFLSTLSASFDNAQITVSDVLENFEVSEAPVGIPAQDRETPVFKKTNVLQAHMISVKIEGVGEVLIGNESQKAGVSAAEAAVVGDAPSPGGKFAAHYLVKVKIHNDREGMTEGTLIKFHKALSLVGLSGVLNATTEDEKIKGQILSFIDMYSPNLSYQIKGSPIFDELSSGQLKKEYLNMIAASEGEERKEALEQLLNAELTDGVDKELTISGSRNTKFHHVGEEMAKAGALGFFAGINSNADVVASVLASGLLSAEARSKMGSKFLSTCAEDAITGGTETIFVRLATEGLVQKMDQRDLDLQSCPYISGFQAIVTLDAANLPHTQRSHNSYGLRNPLAEIPEKGKEASVSGVGVFETLDPVKFTAEQNNDPTVDNEVMLRSEALNSSYIKKIMYQDTRKQLFAYLESKQYPHLAELKEAIAHKGPIGPDLKRDMLDFLNANGLIEERVNRWKGNQIELFIKDFTHPTFKYCDFEALCSDPAENLELALKKQNLLDENGRFKGIPLDEFMVESDSLKREIFENL